MWEYPCVNFFSWWFSQEWVQVRGSPWNAEHEDHLSRMAGTGADVGQWQSQGAQGQGFLEKMSWRR